MNPRRFAWGFAFIESDGLRKCLLFGIYRIRNIFIEQNELPPTIEIEIYRITDCLKTTGPRHAVGIKTRQNRARSRPSQISVHLASPTRVPSPTTEPPPPPPPPYPQVPRSFRSLCQVFAGDEHQPSARYANSL